jgi:hypothetical protein
MMQTNMRLWTMAVAVAAVSPVNAQTAVDAILEPSLKCEQLTNLKIPNSTIVITKATAIADAAPNTVAIRPPLPDLVSVAIPSNCRAEGVIDQRTGSDGKPYAIGFAIALPDR